MNKEKNIDELFRDKLLNYEQEPPAYLLENILSGVAGARRKRKLIYWRIAGVAAALLLAFIAGWQLNDSTYQKTNQAVITVQRSTPEIQPEIKIQSQEVAPNSRNVQDEKQLASVGSNSQIRNNLTKSTDRSSKSETFAAIAESVPVASNNESLLMKPLKSLYRLINSEHKNSITLQEKRNKGISLELGQMSIDQQIMEQNMRLLSAEKKQNEKARWFVGAHISPEYNVSKGSQSQAYASNMLRTSSSNQVDLGGGISVEFKKNKRWSLQSGIYYSGLEQTSGNNANSDGRYMQFASMGENYYNIPVNMDARTNRMSMNTKAGVIELNKIPSGVVVGASLDDKTSNSAVIVSPTSFIQNFDYLEIPLFLRYTLIDARFDVVMLGGLSSNILVGNEISVDNGSGKSQVGKTKDMENLNYSGTLGVGFKYGLSKRISLNVEPRIKYYLNSLNSNSAVSYKPYTIGVFTGLSYEF